MPLFPDLLFLRKKEENIPLIKIQVEVKKAINGPINVYYPGIGGGEEPIDSTSPFLVIDADSVYGIDPYEHPYNLADLNQRRTEYSFDHVERDISEMLVRNGQKSNVIKIENQTELTFKFEYRGRHRTLTISKIPTDGERCVPSVYFNVVYSRRTVGVIENMPEDIYKRAAVVYFEGEVSGDAMRAQRKAEAVGFQNVDLTELTGARSRFFTARLLVKRL